jgi:hypothetical protein
MVASGLSGNCSISLVDANGSAYRYPIGFTNPLRCNESVRGLCLAIELELELSTTTQSHLERLLDDTVVRSKNVEQRAPQILHVQNPHHIRIVAGTHFGLRQLQAVAII